MTLKPDPRVWRDVLIEFGIDGASMKDIFILAQVSDQGRQASNHIISKLLQQTLRLRLCIRAARMRGSCPLGSEARWRTWESPHVARGRLH